MQRGRSIKMQAILHYHYAILAVFWFLYVALSKTENICTHQQPKQHEVFYDVHIEPHHVKRRSVDQPLRIHIHFDESVDSLPLSHNSLIREEVEKAVQYWRETLLVRTTGGLIRLRQQCKNVRVSYHERRVYCINECAPKTVCGEIIIPSEHLEDCYYFDERKSEHLNDTSGGPGVANADFILYVATIQSTRCGHGRTVAYAAHCQQESALDRPVAGYFSVCPDSIAENAQERQQLFSTIKHEILHALGFTASLYAFYRDADGNPLTERNEVTGRPLYFDGMKAMYRWSDKVVKEVTRDWHQRSGVVRKNFSMIVTPKVKEEVQKHFNCLTLEGAELEDQGINGTAITHWEKRVFENEAMTGTYTQNSIISRITLALMEDTGWYKAHYENAGDYEWGKGLGCDFVQKSCYHWISTRLRRNMSIYPYCKQIKRGELWTDCTHNRHAVALCNLVEFSHALPIQYQYFEPNQLQGIQPGEETKYGGSVMLADYCPYLQEFSWTSQQKIVRGSSCIVESNSISENGNYFGESYGNQSRCFNHNGPWLLYKCTDVSSPQHSGSGCYKFSCSTETGLSVDVGGTAYPCYHAGFVHNFTFTSKQYLHKGSVICPDCQEICQYCPPNRSAPLKQLHEVAPPIPCASGPSSELLILSIIICTVTSAVWSCTLELPIVSQSS